KSGVSLVVVQVFSGFFIPVERGGCLSARTGYDAQSSPAAQGYPQLPARQRLVALSHPNHFWSYTQRVGACDGHDQRGLARRAIQYSYNAPLAAAGCTL